MVPISIQPYTVREQIKSEGTWPVFERIAKIGYAGIEVGAVDGDAVAFRRRLEDLGLRASSRAGAFPDKEHVSEVVETAHALGVTNHMIGFWKEEFESVASIEATAKRINEAVELLQGSGVRMCLHNHWFEFVMVEGRFATDRLLDLCPELLLEVDIYWASNFGANDPAMLVRERKARIPLLHVKDGPLVQGQAHLALGDGKVDVPACIAAADPNVLQWLVVELDEFDGDMWEAVERSYSYLSGLA